MSSLDAFHALQERALSVFSKPDILTEAGFLARRRLVVAAAVSLGAAVVLPSVPALMADHAAAVELQVPEIEVSLAVLKLEQSVANIYQSMPAPPSILDLDAAGEALVDIRADIKEALDDHRPAAAVVMAERVMALSASPLGVRAAMHGVDFTLAIPVAAMRDSREQRVTSVLQRLDLSVPTRTAPAQRVRG